MRISDWSSDVCSSDLRVKQWNVVARREPPIGNGAMAAKIDTDNLPNSLRRLFNAAEELHDGRHGFAGAHPHHRYGFAVVECLDGFAFRLLVTHDIRVEEVGMGEIDQIFQADWC